jgi:hypothetical protein
MKNNHELYGIMRRIESALNEPKFRGYEMGATINDILVTCLLNGNYSNSGMNCMRNIAKSVVVLLEPSCTRALPSSFSDRIAFTWMHDRVDYRDLVIPLVDLYGPERSLVIGGMTSMEKALPAGTPFIRWKDIRRAFDKMKWMAEFRKVAIAWLITLARELRNADLSFKYLPLLYYGLISQTQKIMVFERLSDQIRPKAIVTEYDRSALSSCLLLAANRVNIPTITMVHGASFPYPAYGMYPVIADKVMCWGELQKAQFMDCGVDPDKLYITGCQRLSRDILSDRSEVRKRIGVGEDSILVVLPTNPIKPELKLQLASDFCRGIACIENAVGLIRLHPAEAVSEYLTIAREFPEVKILSNDSLTLDESLAAADIVVCHNSGYGSDALIKGRPVIVLDTIDQPLLSTREMIDKAGCPCAGSSAELRQILLELLADGSVRRGSSGKAEAYVHSLCAAFGDDATRNIAAIVDNAVAVRSRA